MKEPKVVITNIEISNQADIDYYCKNLSDSDTFEGNIIVSANEELDYKCLSKIKHIQGTLILNGPGVSKAFMNIESIIGGETFDICDEAVDTMFFPKLRVIDNDLGITISSWCKFSNVLYMPNIETIRSIEIATSAFDEARSGTFMGFDKVKEMSTLSLDSNNSLPDNFKIDGFSNLKKITGKTMFFSINDDFHISDKTFKNLEEIAGLRIDNNYDSESKLSIEDILPKLKSSERVELLHFDPEEVCYLKDYIKSGDIEIVYFESSTNVNYDVESLLVLCE